MDKNLEPGWKNILASEFTKPYFLRLQEFVDVEYRNPDIPIYPPQHQVFRAFELCPLDATRVVLVGQDPYHGAGQANGLCFSVNMGTRVPPSLRNIFKELQADCGRPTSGDSSLESWARQGVLMLNATLTVREGQPASHAGQGWETFTDAVLAVLSQQKKHIVYILWGRYAQQKGRVITPQDNLILESAHPSPLSVRHGFFGSRPFSKTNSALSGWGLPTIDW